jgi:outer membrane protein assembly factor BamB
MSAKSCCLIMIAVLFVPPQTVLAQLKAAPGDWPAWRGPDRTGLSTETGLLREWPKEGPKLLWKVRGLGTGYSTPSVAGGRIFLLGTEGKTELLIALDAKTGERIWSTPIGVTAGGYPGPRCTPTVDGELIYAISSDGKLVCAEAATGIPRWRKDLRSEFGGQSGGWAYTESPLIDGDLLVCTPGGPKATLVTLEKMTGSLHWKSSLAILNGGKKKNYTTAGYSSVIVAEVAGTRQYIQFLSGGVVGVAAKDGKFLWHYDRPANGTANISTPIAHNDAVFAASGYGTGGGQARISANGGEFKAEEGYFVKQLQNHHGGILLIGDHVYGTGSSGLLCVDYKTGKIAWHERGVGKGSVAYADGHLYVRSERGPVALVEATPQGYREKGRFDQPDRSNQSAWAHPIVAGGHLYLRDWDVLLCYDVKANGQ